MSGFCLRAGWGVLLYGSCLWMRGSWRQAAALLASCQHRRRHCSFPLPPLTGARANAGHFCRSVQHVTLRGHAASGSFTLRGLLLFFSFVCYHACFTRRLPIERVKRVVFVYPSVSLHSCTLYFSHQEPHKLTSNINKSRQSERDTSVEHQKSQNEPLCQMSANKEFAKFSMMWVFD